LLQYFDKKFKKSSRDFDILYPKEGTKFQSASCQDVNIEIALQGGVKPYTWYIDGKATQITTTTPKLKLSAGAHTIAATDSTGSQIIRNIWVNAPECGE
ncbi:MAG TPA: hypothetical protein ENK74_02755, partial [Nitratifractor sp.]|nr:hypothetical protein [Nitratifractor sp.]